MSTSRGDITIEVDGDAAPLTAGNFVDLVRRGTYDGTLFLGLFANLSPSWSKVVTRCPATVRFRSVSSAQAVLWIQRPDRPV